MPSLLRFAAPSSLAAPFLRTLPLAAGLGAALMLAGCASTAPAPPALSLQEATAFETRQRAAYPPRPAPPQRAPEGPYVQPHNHTERCKIITTQEQLDRPNFRVFWDGPCKNGFAFGLGRDIAISDTHHLEEITRYGEGGDNAGSPTVFYDFVHHRATYRSPRSARPETYMYSESYQLAPQPFFVTHQWSATDGQSYSRTTETSPLSPYKLATAHYGHIVYRFRDDALATLRPTVQPTLVSDTLDPASGQPGGVALYRYANGQVVHNALRAGGGTDVVALPKEYTDRLDREMAATVQAHSAAANAVQAAQAMEREYLHLACNGRHTIEGLEPAIATRICHWRDSHKGPLQAALAERDRELGKMRAQAASAQQQAQWQQERQRLEQQRQMQGLNQSLQSLARTGQEMQRNAMQFMPPLPAPVVQPLIQPRPSIHCIAMGVVTHCR